MKLDDFSKILIATGQINYMAASINSLNSQIKMVPKLHEAVIDNVEKNDKALERAVKKLSEIMEEMGNIINNQDMVCPIDERVATVPFEILIHGKDDTEDDYEEKDYNEQF